MLIFSKVSIFKMNKERRGYRNWLSFWIEIVMRPYRKWSKWSMLNFKNKVHDKSDCWVLRCWRAILVRISGQTSRRNTYKSENP